MQLPHLDTRSPRIRVSRANTTRDERLAGQDVVSPPEKSPDHVGKLVEVDCTEIHGDNPPRRKGGFFNTTSTSSYPNIHHFYRAFLVVPATFYMFIAVTSFVTYGVKPILPLAAHFVFYRSHHHIFLFTWRSSKESDFVAECSDIVAHWATVRGRKGLSHQCKESCVPVGCTFCIGSSATSIFLPIT